MPPREARILFRRVDRGLSHHPDLDLDLDLDRNVDHAERHKEPERTDRKRAGLPMGKAPARDDWIR